MAIEDLIHQGTRDSVKDAIRSRAEASGHGKDESGQEFAEIQAVVGRFGRRTVAFLQPIFDAVENNLDSLFGLKQTLPLISDTEKAVESAPGLSKADKHKTKRALGLLRTFVTKQTQFNVRAKQVLKNVARDKVQSIKQGMIDNLKDSPSVIKRFVGRQLDQRYGEAASERKQEILNARADAAEELAPDTSESGAPGAARRGKGSNLREMFGGRSRAGEGGVGGGSTRLLGQILATDKGILKEVTKLASTEDEESEDERVEDKAAERSSELKLGDTGDTGVGGKVKKELATKVKEVAGKGGSTLMNTISGGVVEGLTEILLGKVLAGGKGVILGAGKSVLGGAGRLLGGAGRLLGGLATGSGAAAVAGAAAGAAYFAGMFKLIGEKPIATNAVYKEAQKRGLSVADSQGGSNGLTPRIQLYDKLVGEGKTPEDARKIADEARLEKGVAIPRATPKPAPVETPTPTPAPVAPAAPAPPPPRAETTENVAANAGVVPLSPMRLKETLDHPATPSKTERVPSQTAQLDDGKMHISDAGLDKLRKREGLPPGDKESGPYHAYADAGGVWTIGHGLTTIKGKPVKKGDVISAEEEKKEMKEQIAQHFEPDVRAGIGNRPVTQPQFDAMVSMAYNIGVGTKGFSGSTLAKELKAGRDVKQDYFTRWNKVGGVKSAGLVNRRNDEFSQFAGGSAPAMASAVPAGARSAAPVLSTTMAANAPAGAPTVINNYNTTQQGGGTAIPPAIRPKNENESLRAVQGVSAIA